MSFQVAPFNSLMFKMLFGKLVVPCQKKITLKILRTCVCEFFLGIFEGISRKDLEFSFQVFSVYEKKEGISVAYFRQFWRYGKFMASEIQATLKWIDSKCEPVSQQKSQTNSRQFH